MPPPVTTNKPPQPSSGFSRFYSRAYSELASPKGPFGSTDHQSSNTTQGVPTAGNAAGGGGGETSEVPVDELTKLVCGPGGLMNALLQVNIFVFMVFNFLSL